MSRCFPYPPPKYDEAEIGSIKLLKEQEKAKEKNRRKEKKREKKEKKAALKELENSERSKHELKKRKYEESTTKTPNSSAEQLERSGLTEELELPYATQAADNSPERSQDSNKRRKIAPSPGPSQSNNNGIILRIKLPTAKHTQRDTEPPAATFPLANLMVPERAAVLKQRELELTRLQQQGGDFEPCVRREQSEHKTNFGYQQDDSQPACIPQCKASDQEPQPACKEEEPCFSGRSGEAAPLKSEDGRAHTRRKLSRIEKKERQFMDLIMNWNPPRLEQFEDSDLVDQEWLFATSARPSKPNPQNQDRVGKEEGLLSRENGMVSSLQPRACYLPELGIYQLPYVIPY
ncbi:DNA ligase 1-like [Ananas comosus]|uniref:DNA ligase 1-like n=1 Tax=Ananas comosus TaxID=4615 RepID=A0A6P5FC32_ANACO|nr:DNA ligase 1-like [Ananas comosus]